jgi:hypothetical protein
MATNQQLQAYAESLPEIYREILSAFPRLEPTRRQGYGLAFQTLNADFQDRGLDFGLPEIFAACEELQHKGMVEVKHRVFVHPTPLGEQLVAILSGGTSPRVKVPVLPSPPA